MIVTSYLFPDAKFSMDRLRDVVGALNGDRSKLVIDLSCRRQRPERRPERRLEQEQAQVQVQDQDEEHRENSTNNSTNKTTTTDASEPQPQPSWIVAMNKWQTPTDMELSKGTQFPLFPSLSLA